MPVDPLSVPVEPLPIPLDPLPGTLDPVPVALDPLPVALDPVPDPLAPLPWANTAGGSNKAIPNENPHMKRLIVMIHLPASLLFRPRTWSIRGLAGCSAPGRAGAEADPA